MLQQVLEIVSYLDSARVTGEQLADLLRTRGAQEVEVVGVDGDKGHTDFIRIYIPGTQGRAAGGSAPTLGVIGRLGGVGARPAARGIVSDADGAAVALSVALKLLDMQSKGDQLTGDVIITTHICPNAPTLPHDPVPFMGSPVDIATMNRMEVDPRSDALLTIDTTRANRIVNARGFAITPTIKEGYLLKVSPDLLDVMEVVTGRAPQVLAITTQDITPFGNGVDHINSIVQPATATAAPVVGVALTAASVVAGCATGATQEVDIEQAARFCVEVASRFGDGKCAFHNPVEYERLVSLYGSLRHLQTLGSAATR